MSGHRNCRVLFDAQVFTKFANSELTNGRSDELDKIIREHQYVIKSTRLLKHYVGAIHAELMMSAEPFIRSVIDKLESRRPKLTRKISDPQAGQQDIGFRVHSDDHFLYQIVIEASRRGEVLFVSDDPAQLQNSARMITNHNIPIIDSAEYVNEYC